MRRWRLITHLRGSIWLVPVLCVLVGAAISVGTIALDRLSGYDALPASLVGGPDAAIAILSTVAASMVSLTALVLTITMVVVQLAMGQFSPRIVQRILRDKPSQLAIGLFVATFVHAILALREVTNNGDGTGQVPGIAVFVSFVLVLASIAVLVMYVQHIAQALRVSALDRARRQGHARVDRQAVPRQRRAARAGRRRVPRRAGQRVGRRDGDRLPGAGGRGATHRLRRRTRARARGVRPSRCATLARARRRASARRGRAARAIVLKLEPTLDQDVGYGLRLLVDIAERSLADSPLQDPTTAVQAIDRLHDLLRQLVRRPFPDGRHRDDLRRAAADRAHDDVGGVHAARHRGDPPGRCRLPACHAAAAGDAHRFAVDRAARARRSDRSSAGAAGRHCCVGAGGSARRRTRTRRRPTRDRRSSERRMIQAREGGSASRSTSQLVTPDPRENVPAQDQPSTRPRPLS